MIKVDLPELSSSIKDFALESLARTGVTLSDCVAFFAMHRTLEELDYVTKAKRDFHQYGELEVDDTAAVSKGKEDGAYVTAWVWVPK